MQRKIVITLEPERRADLPAESHRLKRLLKTLLRAFGLRCVTIATEEDGENGVPNGEG